jgi:hypothetical protein
MENPQRTNTMYAKYVEFVERTVGSGDLSSFKSSPIYREILEHCSPEFGRTYYSMLRNQYGLSDETILAFCNLNDKVGSPVKYTIGNLSTPVSPASLLYLQHAMRTLDHMESLQLNDVDIVEVGCGYGGYAYALDYTSKLRGIRIRSYNCVDLDGPLRLQELYTNQCNLSFPIQFHSASTYGKNISGTNLFFVSIYCFSEIEKQHQLGYIQHLLPKTTHGLLLWNHIPLFQFGKQYTLVEPETPCTGPGNLLVLF